MRCAGEIAVVPGTTRRKPDVAWAGDAEAVEGGARRVGAVEGVKVDAGNVTVKVIVARSGHRRGSFVSV